jgi:hypothetical protein
VEAAVTETDAKPRRDTFADLRGILRDRVRAPTDEELRQWIDEARSRALDSDLVKRVGRGTQSVDIDENAL